jgi:hypothetical protein
VLLFAGGGFLAVQRDDARQNAGNLLRRVELAGLLAGTGGKLADQVFIGVAQGVLVGGKLRQPSAMALMMVQSLALRAS